MKKGLSLAQFSGLAIVFVVVAVILSVMAQVLQGIQDQQTSNYLPYNITGYGLTGSTTLGSWLPTIAVVVAAAVIIGIIVHYFRG